MIYPSSFYFMVISAKGIHPPQDLQTYRQINHLKHYLEDPPNNKIHKITKGLFLFVFLNCLNGQRSFINILK